MSTTDEAGHIRRVAENPAAVFLLALMDGAIVGSLLGTFDGWRGNMYRLVVLPEHRRQGIGRELVRRVEAAFRDWGVKRTTVLIEVGSPTRNGVLGRRRISARRACSPSRRYTSLG